MLKSHYCKQALAEEGPFRPYGRGPEHLGPQIDLNLTLDIFWDLM